MQGRAILGIVGNTGPEADETLQRLIRLEAMSHGAKKDQDFLPMIVIKNPEITDRTLAIFEGGQSPAIGIAQSCGILASCGVYLAALPSNTSHYFRDEYQANTDVFVIDIIGLTTRALSTAGVDKAGILATTPTIRTGVFEKLRTRGSPEYVAPAPDLQDAFVQAAIYGSLDASGRHDRRNPDGLKSGCDDIAVQRLSVAIESLMNDGIRCFVTACTEVSIVVGKLRELFPSCTFIDPVELLATHAYALTLDVQRLLDSGRTLDDVSLDDALSDEMLIAPYVAAKIATHLQVRNERHRLAR